MTENLMTPTQYLELIAKATENTNKSLDELEPFTTMDLSLVPDEVIRGVIAHLISQVRSTQQAAVEISLKYLEKSEEVNALKKQIKK